MTFVLQGSWTQIHPSYYMQHLCPEPKYLCPFNWFGAVIQLASGMCRLFIMLEPILLCRHIVYVVVIVLHLVAQGGRCYSFINLVPQQLWRLYSWGSVEPQATAAAGSRGGSRLIEMDSNCCGARPWKRAQQQNAAIT